MAMKYILRWAFRLNQEFNQLQEPRRILTIIIPFMIVTIFSGLIELFTSNPILSLLAILCVPVLVCIMGIFVVVCKMGNTNIDKDWVNTYIVGWPFRLMYSVQIEYSMPHSLFTFKEIRDEIADWTSEHMKFYHGEFSPNGRATFYFLKKTHAMAFKLRW